LSVNESEQEKVLKAAEDINKAIKLLQDNYAVKDKQDLLAMTALQLATKEGKAGSSAPADYTDIEAKLEELSSDLDA
jgi:cell division protein ZapA